MRPGAAQPSISPVRTKDPERDSRDPERSSRRDKATLGVLVALRRYPITPWVLLVALLCFREVVSPGSVSLRQVNTDASSTIAMVFVAFGLMCVLLIGGIDLSVAGVLSVANCFAATKMHNSVSSQVLWVVLIVAFGLAAGVLNGALIEFLKLPAFVVTLATWSMWNGLALWILPIQGGNVPANFENALSNNHLGLATPVWIIVGLLLFWFWFSRTDARRALQSVGSDRDAAELSGVSVRLTTVGAYAICGGFAALAGILLASQTASGAPDAGDQFLLPAIASVVIGGTSIFGGRGGFGGVLAGAFILTEIGALVFALGLSSAWTPIASGALLVAAMVANSLVDRAARSRIS
jgi:ribose transport system permease protein